MVKKIKSWIQKNRIEFLMILLILIVALGMRLYKIDQYMTFLGDEGRDALIIKDLLVNHHIPFIGPPTSVGNMYNGPLYYYMMGVAMAIGWLNPVAAAVMVALLSTATVGLIYYLSREWFNKYAAVTASILYAFSPVTIIYGRSSWNPNPAPFFGLLSIIGIYFARKYKNFYWFILSGCAIAFAVQMHYLALILAPVVGLLWIYELYRKYFKKQRLAHFWGGTIGAILGFLLLMSPLVLFDLKHNFMNFRAMQTFFLGDRATTVNLNIFNTFGRFPHVFIDLLIKDHFALNNPILPWIVFILILVPIIWQLYRLFVLKKGFSWPILACTIWFLGGVAGLSLYKQTVYDHYLSFFNPVPFLLLGANFKLREKLKVGRWGRSALLGGLGVLGIIILGFEITHSPLLSPPNNQLQKTQDIAHYLIKLSDNKPFNFALLSEHNYDAAYQFYLSQFGHTPAKLPFEKTDQLLVVCEDPVCKPVGNPKDEIARFGWTQIAFQTEYDGVKIFKLIQYQGNANPTK